MIEKTFSLRRAAAVLGISPKTLKRWLARDLAIVLPEVERGSKALIRLSDLDLLLKKRAARSDWRLLGKGSAA